MKASSFLTHEAHDFFHRVLLSFTRLVQFRGRTVEIRTSLTKLPPELRLMIYEFVLADVRERRFLHPLLKVSKIIRHEFMPILLEQFQLTFESVSPWYLPARWAVALRPLGLYRMFETHPLQGLRDRGILKDLLPYIRTYQICHTARHDPGSVAVCTMIFFDRNSKVRPNEIELDYDLYGDIDNSKIERYLERFRVALGSSNECSMALLDDLLRRLQESRSAP